MDEQTLGPCPFCGWQADGALRTDRGLTLCHDGKGCALTGLWFQVDLWNARAAHSVMAGKVAELEAVIMAIRNDAAIEKNEQLEAFCDAALAPYPERRSERHE